MQKIKKKLPFNKWLNKYFTREYNSAWYTCKNETILKRGWNALRLFTEHTKYVKEMKTMYTYN